MKKTNFIGAGLAAAVFSFASTAGAAPFMFSETGPGLDDIDNATEVSITQMVTTAGIITDLNISVTTDRFFPEEVTFTLSKDGGPSVIFWNVNFTCSGSCNTATPFTLTFDDEVGRQLNTGDLLDNVAGRIFQPSGQGNSTLSAFDGVELAGTWRLTMVDNNTFPGDGTDLFEWTIFGDADIAMLPEPGTLVLFGLGLAGLAAVRRRR